MNVSKKCRELWYRRRACPRPSSLSNTHPLVHIAEVLQHCEKTGGLHENILGLLASKTQSMQWMSCVRIYYMCFPSGVVKTKRKRKHQTIQHTTNIRPGSFMARFRFLICVVCLSTKQTVKLVFVDMFSVTAPSSLGPTSVRTTISSKQTYFYINTSCLLSVRHAPIGNFLSS